MRGLIDRYVVLEMHVESWEQYFMRAGLMTRQGRVRSGYTGGYLASVVQLMRLAQIIGLDKMERPINETPSEWLDRRARERQAAGDVEGSIATTSTTTSTEEHE